MNYFVFNKPLDYRRGYMEGCVPDGTGIRLKEGAKEGVFFSRVLDSRDRGNEWGRLSWEPAFGAAEARLLIYSLDERRIPFQGRMQDAEEIAKDSRLTGKEKRECFAPFLRLEVAGERDVLLFDVKGRYLWFALILSAGQEGGARAGNLFFYFPKETWMKYLPAVYERDRESAAFLERYLGIFKSFYDDLNREIENSSLLLDPAVAPTEYLAWLGSFLDLGQETIWEEGKMRKLLKMAPELFLRRGTKRGLLDLVELYTGERPYLVESFEILPYLRGEKKEALERLYGTDEAAFVLLVKEKYMTSRRERDAILSIVREAAPAHMEVRLEALRPFIFLGEYSYLGINSGLGFMRDIRLDGLSKLTFASIGGGERREDEHE